MTREKHTLTLDASEYKALLLANLVRAHDFVTRSTAIGEHLVGFCAHMDRMKVLASAWHFAAPAIEAKAEAVAETVEQPKVNGAQPPKRRGGWPRGKPRKSQAEQVQ